MLTKEDFKEMELGTILVDAFGSERYFYCLNIKRDQFITSLSNLDDTFVSSFSLESGRNWKIKESPKKELGEVAWFLDDHNNLHPRVQQEKLICPSVWKEVEIIDGKVYEKC